MRYFTLLLVLLASNAFATPITFLFTGEVTNLRLADGWGSAAEIVANDPAVSTTWNGINVVNGDTRIAGAYTFDSDIPRAGGPYEPYPNPFPLLWLFSTEGITFQKTAGRICGPCSFNYDETGVVSHIEYLESSTSSSPLMSWNYMTFEFNFSDGHFTGGSFDFVSEGPLSGFMKGTIDQVLVVGVPEPSSFLLFLGALLPLWYLRRRRSVGKFMGRR